MATAHTANHMTKLARVTYIMRQTNASSSPVKIYAQQYVSWRMARLPE